MSANVATYLFTATVRSILFPAQCLVWEPSLFTYRATVDNLLRNFIQINFLIHVSSTISTMKCHNGVRSIFVQLQSISRNEKGNLCLDVFNGFYGHYKTHLALSNM